MRCIRFLLLFFFCSGLLRQCLAQDSALIHFILQRIAEQQVKHDDFFLPGIFPSYITGVERFSEKKKDNNVFFNGLIDYTLKEIRPHLNPVDQSLLDSILRNAEPLYEHFKNRQGRSTYNFWRTDSAYDYPYAGIFKVFAGKISLPDDFDDTVLSLLALDADDSTAASVHRLMQHYVNSDSNVVRSVIKEYDTLPAYSTWFGKNFPVVFDASVLCNVLSFVELYNLPWTSADSASLSFITGIVRHGDHLNRPVYISPYYPKSSLILYHIARLMSIAKIPELESLKSELVKDAGYAFAESKNTLEKIILSSAILKWGYIPPRFKIPDSTEITRELEKNDYSFFVGNIPSYMHALLRRYATMKDIGFFYHYCPAYNDALLLEYLVLENQ